MTKKYNNRLSWFWFILTFLAARHSTQTERLPFIAQPYMLNCETCYGIELGRLGLQVLLLIQAVTRIVSYLSLTTWLMSTPVSNGSVLNMPSVSYCTSLICLWRCGYCCRYLESRSSDQPCNWTIFQVWFDSESFAV